MDDLILFLDNPPRNAWIYCMSYNPYVRKGYHMIEGVASETFDMANIHIRETLRGKGQFRVLLSKIEEILLCHSTGIKTIYIESVLNTEFAQYLLKSNFQHADQSSNMRSANLYRHIKR